MARENQGLQIALIIFVMLTVVLGVTTFLFYRKYDEALRAKADADKEAREQRDIAEGVKRDCGELKKMMGYAATKTFQEVSDAFKKDMEANAGNFPEDARFYSPLVVRLKEAIEEKSSDLKGVKKDLDDLKARYAAREGTKDGQIAGYVVAVKNSGEELKKARGIWDAEVTRIHADQDQLAKQMAAARKEQTEKVSLAEAKVVEAQGLLKVANKINEDKTKKIQKLDRQTMDRPSGEVTWSDQRTGTVWINLGRADGLEPRISFAVYSAGATELGKAAKKASIEVTRIDGEHSAQARVLEDKVVDPILPGDKIYTPLWTPGERNHFALAGFMDIDGDGKDNMVLVKNLITMNGGVIDAELDDKGKKSGEMSINTRYLVLGDEPSTKGKPEAFAGYSRMMTDAERLGIKKMTLGELKEKMGYKKQVSVDRFTRPTGGPPPKRNDDSRAKPAASDDDAAAATPKPRATAKPAAKAGKPAGKPAGKAAGKAEDDPF